MKLNLKSLVLFGLSASNLFHPANADDLLDDAILNQMDDEHGKCLSRERLVCPLTNRHIWFLPFQGVAATHSSTFDFD